MSAAASALKALAYKLDQADVRMESMLLLAGMLTDGGYSIPDSLRQLIDYEEDEVLARLFPDMPASVLARREESEDCFMEAFVEWVNSHDKWGYLVQFATPCDHNGRRGWGSYYTCWIYGETVDEAVNLGLQWAAARRLDDQRRIAERGGNS